MRKILNVLILAVFFSVLPKQSFAIDVSGCGVLNTISGSYTLTTDIGTPGSTDTCLYVTATNITIDLNGKTVHGHISGNGSSTLGYRTGRSFTVKNGRVEGNLTSRGLDGVAGGNGANGSNGDNSIDNSGTGNGGLGGAGGSNGGACTAASAGMDGGPGGDTNIGGQGGTGGDGQIGCVGSRGFSINVQDAYINGYISTKGGNGGRGGNGGNGGNGGSANGDGGAAGNGGAGGDSSHGGNVTVSTSTIVGYIEANAGLPGAGGNGGNGGNGSPSLGFRGFAGAGASGGANIGVAGSVSIINSKIVSGIINAYRSSCAAWGVDGQPGEGEGEPSTPSAVDLCNSAFTDTFPTITITDTPPTLSFAGQANVTLTAGSEYVNPTVSVIDGKDGVLVPSVEGVFNPLIPGTYTRVYIARDAGTVLTVNGVTITYQSPQEVRTSQQVVVLPSNYSTIGGSSSGGDTISTGGIGIPDKNKKDQTDNVSIRAGGACQPILSKNIYLGNRNNKDEVKKLQDILNRTIQAGLVEDGIFGKKTKQAVINFQKKKIPKKPATGSVLKTTRDSLNTAACGLVKY